MLFEHLFTKWGTWNYKFEAINTVMQNDLFRQLVHQDYMKLVEFWSYLLLKSQENKSQQKRNYPFHLNFTD